MRPLAINDAPHVPDPFPSLPSPTARPLPLYTVAKLRMLDTPTEMQLLPTDQ